MAIYTHTVTHALEFAESVAYRKSFPDFAMCIARDLWFTDGRTPVIIHGQDQGVYNPLAGSVEFSNPIVQTVNCNKSMVTHRDIQQSNGFLRISDVKFRAATVDLEFTPKQGYRLYLNSVEYEIIGVDLQVLGTQVLMWCRLA